MEMYRFETWKASSLKARSQQAVPPLSLLFKYLFIINLAHWDFVALRIFTASREIICCGSGVGHLDLVTPGHVGSSETRDGTQISCIGKWILNH